MYRFRLTGMTFFLFLSIIVVPVANADPIDSKALVSEVLSAFAAIGLDDTILDAAKSLFWSLATISLVWTMGMLIVRQDIGELLMELLRFIVVTGLFYWVLVNASSRQGGEDFVGDIVSSFLQMVSQDPSDSTVRTGADDVLSRGLNVFVDVIGQAADGEDPDRVVTGGMAVAVLCLCAVIAAQSLLALVMAWILGYAGIFLLGFGGARWTSPIAINYYKHVVAVGIALLALSIIGTTAANLLGSIGIEEGSISRVYSGFAKLGLMLSVSILMMVLSIKVPQLLYTLVTGSIMGLYSGSASAAGAAIASAGGAAYATAFGRSPGGGAGPGGGLPHGGGSSGSGQHRTESVMDAVQRSGAAVSGMADPFHVHSGADPFGVQRVPDPHRGSRGGSVFGNASVGSAPTAPVVDLPGGGGSAPEVVAPKGPASPGTSRPGQGATRDREAIQAASASSGAAGDTRAGVGRPVEAGVDVAFDESDTARAAVDAIPRETQDLPGQGHSGSLRHVGVEDLRAHTRSADDTKNETYIDAHTDATIDTHNAVSGNAPGLASNVTAPTDVKNESLSHADDTDSAPGHDDVRTSGSRRTGANASAVQRATSRHPEDAMYETGMDAVQASTSTSSMPHELNRSTSTTDTRIERTTADASPESRVMGKEHQAHIDTSSHMNDRMGTTEAMRSEGEISAVSSATAQADTQVQTTTAPTQVADGQKHARASNSDAPSTGVEVAQPEGHPAVHGDAGHAATLSSTGAPAPDASTSGHIDTPHSEKTASEPSAARVVGIEPAVHTGAMSNADRETQTTATTPPIGNQALPSRNAPTKSSPDLPSTSLVQEDMQVAQPTGETLEVVSGARVDAPPNLDVHAAAEPAASADEPLPRRRKRRVRHREDENQPTMPPPLDDAEHAGGAPP